MSLKNNFFLSPTDSLEVEDIRSSLSVDKSHGPNGIPTKILLLLKHDIAPILTDLFNLSFSSGVFRSALKIAKMIPIQYIPIYSFQLRQSFRKIDVQ